MLTILREFERVRNVDTPRAAQQRDKKETRWKSLSKIRILLSYVKKGCRQQAWKCILFYQPPVCSLVYIHKCLLFNFLGFGWNEKQNGKRFFQERFPQCLDGSQSPLLHNALYDKNLFFFSKRVSGCCCCPSIFFCPFGSPLCWKNASFSQRFLKRIQSKRKEH